MRRSAKDTLGNHVLFCPHSPGDRTENPLTLAIARVRAEGRQVVDLTESNPTRAALVDTSPLIAELGHPRGVSYEPLPLGHIDARRAVARYYQARG